MTVAPVDTHLDLGRVWFWPAGRHIDIEIARTLVGFDASVDALLIEHPRLRRVVLRYGDDMNVFGAVHWSDGRDLDDLDRRASAGDDISGDLEAGIFVQVTRVTDVACGVESVVAAIGTGLPAVTMERRRRRRTDIAYVCPRCGADRFPGHVEVFAGA